MNRVAKIAELELQADALRDRLSLLVTEISALRTAEVCERFGIKEGSLLRSARGHKRAVYKLTKIDRLWNFDKPWVLAQLQRKDGTFGTAEHRMYSDWEVIQ